MRATTYSLLAAFISLAGLEHSQCYAAEPNRPHYYFPRAIKRPGVADQVEKRDPPADAKEPRDGNLLGLDEITVGLDGVLGDPPNDVPETTTSTINPEDGITFPGGAPTGDEPVPVPEPTPTEVPTEDEDGGLLDKLLPTLPGFGDIFPSEPESESTTTLTPTPSSGESASPTGPSSATTTSDDGGLINLPGFDDILPGKSESESTTTPTPSSEESASSTTPSSATKTSDGGLIDLPDLLPTDLFPSPDRPEDSSSSPSESETSKPGLLPDLPLFPPPTPSESGSSPSSPGLDLPSLLPSLPIPSLPVPSIPGLLPTDSTDGLSIPLPTSLPSGIFPSDPSHSGTGLPVPVPFPTPTDAVSSSPESSSSSSTSTPSSKPRPSPEATTTPTTTEHRPLSTDSNTKMDVPTEIVFQPPPPSETSETTTAEQTPTPVPKLISPPKGADEIPPDSTLIQLGFNPSLNYDFVAGLTTAVTQLFEFVPLGVSYGLGIDAADVAMKQLQPYEPENKDYRVTLAMMYIPKDLVDKLSVSLFNPNAKLYTHPDVPVSTLMSAIDPSIPLIPGDGAGGVPQGGDNGPGSGPDNEEKKDGGEKGGDGTGKSGGVQASAVGIGLGVVGGAALYGAAMFYVAKRYRQKRRSHQRTSSVTGGYSDGSSRPVSPSEGLMTAEDGRDTRNSGGTGSNRSQMISAPVMSENSLGWN